MIERLKKLLKDCEVHEYQIIEASKESREYFYVLKKLETNRATKTTNYSILIYTPFEKEEASYLGSARIEVFASETDQEIKDKIQEAIYSSKFIMNAPYELAPKESPQHFVFDNSLNNQEISYYAEDIIKAIYRANNNENGWINSVEIFINKIKLHFVGSNQTDLLEEKSYAEVEVIPTWKENNLEVELYKDFKFVNVDPSNITKEVEDILEQCKDRALATKLESIPNVPVILHATDALDIFNFYASECNYASVFTEESHAKLHEAYQKEDALEKINLSLVPLLKNSPSSSMFNMEGRLLNPVTLYKDGVVETFCGGQKFGSYLKQKGMIEEIIPAPMNIKLQSGTESIEHYKETSYLEVVSFSAFQFDEFTGYFGGEVRLAYYFDGENRIPVTGLSVSGNIYEDQNHMNFSKEMVSEDGYEGPKYVVFHQMKIA